ncbi:MAG: hypothetical protein N3E49_01100 [Bacteroidia bacterium]|nr:hypothetical protein [Bacteroidia bacterium]
MLLLLLWSQSWQIPTAYKQVARDLHLFSGYAQQAWVGYLSNREGTTHLYLHLIDTSGYEPLGKNGMCLSCGVKDPVTTWQASLGEKNWLYIAWSTSNKTYLRGLNEDGVIWWNAEVPFPAQELALLAQPAGGLVALLRRENVLRLYFWDIRGQLLSENVLSSESPCRHIRLIGGSIEGFLVLWETYTGHRWEVFFQKWLWQGKSDTPARPLSQLPHSTEGLDIISDGFGGMLCVYEGISLSGFGKDLYLVRYNRMGSRLYEVPICREPGDQQSARIYKRGTELLVVWEDSRHQDWDLYYQQIDISTGKPLLSPEGVPLVRLPGPQRSTQLVLDYFQNELIALWIDYRRLQGDIYFQRYSAEGKPLWEFAGRPLVTRPSQQHSLRIAAQDFQLFWVAYLDDEGEIGTQPHIALLTTQGEIRLHRRLAGNTKRPYAQVSALSAATWNGRLILLWRDDRDSADRPQLYAQLLSAEGQPLWPDLGVAIGPQLPLTQKSVQLHLQGDTLWLLWEAEETDVESDLFVQALTPQGKKLFSKPLPVCNADRVQTEAQWLAHSNRLYVYWTDNRSMEETGFDLYLRSIAPLSPEIGWRVTRTFQNSPFLAFAGDVTQVHHVWQEELNGRYQIAYSFGPIGTNNPTFLSPTSKPQRFLHAITDEQGGLYLAFCEEAPDPYQQALRVIAVSSTGERRWQHTSPLGYNHHLYPRLYRLPSGEILVLCLGHISGRWDLVYGVFSREGSLVQKGLFLSPVPERTTYHLLHDGHVYRLLLRIPTGYLLYEGTRLDNMKPAKLPDPTCAEAWLFSWKGTSYLFWTDSERKRCTLSALPSTP